MPAWNPLLNLKFFPNETLNRGGFNHEFGCVGHRTSVLSVVPSVMCRATSDGQPSSLAPLDLPRIYIWLAWTEGLIAAENLPEAQQRMPFRAVRDHVSRDPDCAIGRHRLDCGDRRAAVAYLSQRLLSVSSPKYVWPRCSVSAAFSCCTESP
jgi:hypothetical protein